MRRRFPRPGLGGTFASFGSRNFQFFFLGQVVSISGTWMQRVAQDWLILELGGGSLGLSIGLALQAAPYVTIGIWGGLVVDRIGARKMFIASQTVLSAFALVVGLLVLTDHISLLVVYASALAVGIVGVIESPSRQAFVLEIVPREQAANAVSLYSSLNNVARLCGPAVAGFLIGWAGTGWAFVLNSFTFYGIIAAVLLMDRRQLRTRTVLPARPGQVREAVALSMNDSLLRPTLVATFLISAFAQHFRVILPIFSTQVFHLGPESYGTLMSAVAVGALVGALVCARISNPTLRMLSVQSLGLGAGLLAASLAPTYLVLAALMAFSGISNTAFNTTSSALVAVTAEPEMRGRLVSIRTLVNNGATLGGTLIIGYICEITGPREALAVGGAVALLTAVLTRRGRTAEPLVRRFIHRAQREA